MGDAWRVSKRRTDLTPDTDKQVDKDQRTPTHMDTDTTIILPSENRTQGCASHSLNYLSLSTTTPRFPPPSPHLLVLGFCLFPLLLQRLFSLHFARRAGEYFLPHARHAAEGTPAQPSPLAGKAGRLHLLNKTTTHTHTHRIKESTNTKESTSRILISWGDNTN